MSEEAVPEKNSLGIPPAEFVEDVDTFMGQAMNQGNPEVVLRRLDEDHQKYKFMQVNLLRRKKILKKQVPEIKSSLQILAMLKKKKNSGESLSTHFLLNDQVYANAKISPTNQVCLWLGANVMLEYTIQDAEDLLSGNLNKASQNLAQVEADLDYLNDQITITEVNMARVYNWSVKKKKSEKQTSQKKVAA